MASGKGTHEHRIISSHSSMVVESLAKTVNPGNFAQKLQDAKLIGPDVVEQARVSSKTASERIHPVISAVQAQIELKASLYNQFVGILKDFNPHLAGVLSKFLDLQLKAPGVLSDLSNWQNLGRELGVDSERLAELEQSGKDPSQCKEEVIGLWVEKDRSATWGNLTQALDQMGEDEISRRIKDTYIPQPPPQEPAQLQLEPVVNGTSLELDDSSIQAKVKKFEFQFERLTSDARSEVEEKQTSLKMFRHSLTCLPIHVRPDHLPYIKENLDDIKKAGSIEELFLTLNLYWSFLDYSLLEHLVERYGSEDLTRRMSQYVEDMVLFRQMTTVGQLIRIWPGRVEPPPNFSHVTSKLNKSASEYTLEELENLRRRFCSQFRLSDCVLMLAGGSDGSVVIFWYIPSSLASELTAAICLTESSFFEQLGVLKLEVDGFCAFEQKYTTEPQSLKVKSEEDVFPEESQTPEEKSVHVVPSSPQREEPPSPEESDQQQMETEQEIQLTVEQLCALQEENRELSAILEQREAQLRYELDHERREKEHFQQRVKELQDETREKEEEYYQHSPSSASSNATLVESDDSSVPPSKRPRLSPDDKETPTESPTLASSLTPQPSGEPTGSALGTAVASASDQRQVWLQRQRQIKASSKALRKHFPKLMDLMEGSWGKMNEEIAAKLYSIEIIDEETMGMVCDENQSTTARTAVLLAVQKEVRRNPKVFETFCDILDKSSLGSVATELRESYKAELGEETEREAKPPLAVTQPYFQYQTSTVPQEGSQKEAGAKVTWKQGKFAPQPLHKGTAVVHGNKAYFIGADSSTIQEYDIETEEWEGEIECDHEGPALVFTGDLLTAIGGHKKRTQESQFPRQLHQTNARCQKEAEVTNKVMSIDMQKPDQGWLEKYPPMPTKKVLPQAVHTGEYLIAIGKKAGYEEIAVEVMKTSPPYQWQRAKGPTIQLSAGTCRSTVVCKDNLYLATHNSVAHACLNDIVESCTTVSNPVRKKVVWREIPYPGVLVPRNPLGNRFVFTTLVTLEDHLLCLSHEHRYRLSMYNIHVAMMDMSSLRLEIYDLHKGWVHLVTSDLKDYNDFCEVIATALPAPGRRLAIVGGRQCHAPEISPHKNVYLASVDFEL